MNDKRNIFLWVLYDFANSIVIVTFFLYFSEWLVIDAGFSPILFNSIFIGSTILLLLTAPIVAAISDKIKKRRIFLNIATIGTFICFFITAFFAHLGIQYVWGAAIFSLFSQFFYQFSFVFYNPMIEELASVDKRGKISGLGQTANWVGQIVGVLIFLPLASHGRSAPLLPAVIISFVLVLPMLIFFKEKRSEQGAPLVGKELKSETKKFLGRFYHFVRYSPASLFLIAFFFFNDAVITLQNNFPILIDKVFSINDKTKSILLLVILAASALGAYGSGWIGDRIGLKKMMKIILICWVFIIPLLATATSFRYFIVLTGIMGLFYGSIWAVARAYLSRILPEKEMNYGFSFYTLAERFSTFVGPLTWGIVIASVGSTSFGYRIAALSMTIFVIVGYFFIRKIPRSRKNPDLN